MIGLRGTGIVYLNLETSHNPVSCGAFEVLYSPDRWKSRRAIVSASARGEISGEAYLASRAPAELHIPIDTLRREQITKLKQATTTSRRCSSIVIRHQAIALIGKYQVGRLDESDLWQIYLS